MAHWVQYHTPVRMGCGIDEGEGPPFAVLSDKVPFTDVGGPIGEVVWLVGLRDAPGSPVYLGEWFVIDDVEASDNEEIHEWLRSPYSSLPPPSTSTTL